MCILRFRDTWPWVGGKGPSCSQDVDSTGFSIDSSTCGAQPPPVPLLVASIRPPVHSYSRDSLHIDSATCTLFCFVFFFSEVPSVSSTSQLYPHGKLSPWQLHEVRLQARDQASVASIGRPAHRGAVSEGGISPVSDSSGCRGLPAGPDSFNVTHQILCQAYPKNL